MHGVKHIKFKQRGVATLATAVVLMLAVFGISYFMSEVVLTETRVVANHQRGLEAFAAAQSGIELAKVNNVESGTLNASYPSDPVSFVVTATEIQDGLIKLESVGYSNDLSVSRTISYYKARKPGEGDPPQVPIVARGGVNTSGNISAVNNYSNLTIWNGLSTGIQGSASTYTSIDGQKNQLSTIKNTSGASTYGADVVTGDQNLANATIDEIVASFFDFPTLRDMARHYGMSDPGDVTYGSTYSGAESSNSDHTDGFVDLSVVSSTSAKYCYVSNCTDTTTDPSSPIYAVDAFAGYGNFNLSSISQKIASDLDLSPSDYLSWENASGRTFENLDDGFSGSRFGYSVTATDADGDETFAPDSSYIGSPDNPIMIVVDGEVTIPSNTYIFGVVVANKIRMQSNSSVFGGVVALSSDSDAFQGAGGAVVFMDEIITQTAGEEVEYGPVKSAWRDW
ncbi:MAG: pilus assembly PilX N-terminal domain-containing protein [Gammaproteobacteria bacterium]|nr:pilus assembly PilX N-terminal domain-containing protein [Gammaproteobacteria bacterium]